MKQAQHKIVMATEGQGLYEFTDQVVNWVSGQGIAEGLLTVFCTHTSASLTIQENADSDVSLSIPVQGGRPTLGTWQGIYLFEHRTRPHSRTVILQLMGN